MNNNKNTYTKKKQTTRSTGKIKSVTKTLSNMSMRQNIKYACTTGFYHVQPSDVLIYFGQEIPMEELMPYATREDILEFSWLYRHIGTGDHYELYADFLPTIKKDGSLGNGRIFNLLTLKMDVVPDEELKELGYKLYIT